MLRREKPFPNFIGCGLIAGILLAGSALTFANDYPPQPGAYRSEPIALPSRMESMDDTATAQQETSDSTVSKPGLLPIPVEETAPESPYDSDVLFGAAKPSTPPAPQEAARPQPDFAVDSAHKRSRGMPQGPTPPRIPYGNYPGGYWNPQPQPYYPSGVGNPRFYTGPTNAYPSAEPPPGYAQPNYDLGPPPQALYPQPGDSASDIGPTFRPPGQ